MAPEVEEKKHAKYSASGSERWISCPGSITLSERAPEEVESDYAREGTNAHFCLEMFLKNDRAKTKAARQLLEKSGTYPAEMIDHAEAAAREIWAMHDALPGSELLSETKAELDFVQPGMFGTTDAAVVQEFGRLIVTDFKYGAGVLVDPENNSQLAYYALGIAAKHDYNFVDVELVVIQPRAFHPTGETVRRSVISVAELRGWEKTFRDGVERCEDPFADLAPGDWCRFCPARVLCPALSDRALAEARLEFTVDDGLGSTAGELVAPPVTGLAAADLSTALKAADRLEDWISAVRSFAHDTLVKGGTIPGFKLVEKRSTRHWKDEAKAAKEAKRLFGDKAFSAPELLSPAQLEKAMGRKATNVWVAERVTQISSGLTLVTEADKRPACNSVAADFDVLPVVEVVDVVVVPIVDSRNGTVLVAKAETVITGPEVTEVDATTIAKIEKSLARIRKTDLQRKPETRDSKRLKAFKARSKVKRATRKPKR